VLVQESLVPLGDARIVADERFECPEQFATVEQRPQPA
jgi:hypothetical protein